MLLESELFGRYRPAENGKKAQFSPEDSEQQSLYQPQ
jgi:hypothetical protein